MNRDPLPEPIEEDVDDARADDAPETSDSTDATQEDGTRRLSGALHHFRWDLDKTYLRTEFDSIRDLVRTFRQKADEKVGVPGAATLLRQLLESDSPKTPRRVTFISGSPRQMRKVLTEKLRLDGIEPVEFILKPNLSNLLKLRIKAVRGQVGYKLEALLRTRIYADRSDESLFGDDAEHDAYIYSLYADLLNGRIGVRDLEEILVACNVYSRDADRILELHSALKPATGDVRRIFIHLDRRSPVRRFRAYGARVVPIFNYFQAAVLLHGDGLLTGSALVSVLESMRADGYTPTRIANSVQDLMRRGFLSRALFGQVELAISNEEAGEVGSALDFLVECRRALEVSRARPRPAPQWVDDVDYLTLADAARWRRIEAPLRAFRFLE